MYHQDAVRHLHFFIFCWRRQQQLPKRPTQYFSQCQLFIYLFIFYLSFTFHLVQLLYWLPVDSVIDRGGFQVEIKRNRPPKLAQPGMHIRKFFEKPLQSHCSRGWQWHVWTWNVKHAWCWYWFWRLPHVLGVWDLTYWELRWSLRIGVQESWGTTWCSKWMDFICMDLRVPMILKCLYQEWDSCDLIPRRDQ